MSEADQQQRLDALKAKLASRRGKHGYEENVQDLEREIAILEAKQ